MSSEQILTNLGLMLVYFVLGLVFLVLGKLFWNFITPYDDDVEIRDKKNKAVGIVQAGVFLAVAIIIHGALAGKSPFADQSFGTKLLYDSILSSIYFVVSLFILWLGGKLADVLSHHKVHDAVAKDQNEASAFFVSGFYISLAVIIHAAL